MINETDGFESLDVAGNRLPDPAVYGSNFGAYAFPLAGSGSGTPLAVGLMVPISAGTVPGDGAGSFSPGVHTIPKAVVTVYPTGAGSATGPYGPPVLAGDLILCR
ncbi:MAG: hypothetical protein OWV35_08610 [Firmicutes bacterium]|nr:hypothetical protein [Bacillota bacterium]